jgi:hypothetical protein
MGSARLIVSLLCVVLLSAVAAPGFAQEGEEDKAYTLANLRAVSDLRCDAIRRGKVATRQADIYRTEAYHARGIAQIQAEQRMSDSEAGASAAFEEAGRLKRRLARMVDAYVSARRLEWYQTVDHAVKIRVEGKILFAQELLQAGCS